MPRHPALMALSPASAETREEFRLSRAEKPEASEPEKSESFEPEKTRSLESEAATNPNEPWWMALEAGEKSEVFQDRSRKLGKGKPARRRTVSQLYAASDIDFKNDQITFIDKGLEELHTRGLIREVLWQLKSGKEATVYVCEGQTGLVAAKLYVDSRVRGFKDDALYREGRHVDDKRLKKAIDQRSDTGISAQNFLWVQEEFMQLHALHAAGVRVPKPLAHEASVILMEFIGNEEEVAPRVADARLTREQAEIAFADALDQYGRILATGRVHGDFSTFNLLWWQGKCVVIDFPQVVTVKQPTAKAILERDVQGLCRTFSTYGIKKDWQEALQTIQRKARLLQSEMLSEEMENIL
jgi:RIO kinase 1